MSILKGSSFKKDTLTGGTTNDKLYGYDLDDVLNGLAGNDTLYGGGGADSLNGGLGNDTYFVDNVQDVIHEITSAGMDTVKVSLSWSLAANLEKLVLTGTNSINGMGNALNNTITGNSANNVLSGDAGNDTLDSGFGFDTLNGGAGNDTLTLKNFVNDVVDGGSGIDNLQILGNHQMVDIRTDAIKNIEAIQFADNSHSTLKLTALSVLNLNLTTNSNRLTVDGKGENTLIMEAGWTDGGIVGAYQTFTKSGVTLKVSSAINHIEIATLPDTYTIANASTAAQVKSAFTSGVDEISIDFGGKAYKDTGVTAIDLTGFALNDKLIIAQHDGALNRGGAFYNGYGSRYISELGQFGDDPVDLVFWQKGATQARLMSSGNMTHKVPTYYITNQHVHRYTTFFGGPGMSFTTTKQTITKETVRGTLGSIQITGLPSGLPDSQFVFV